MKVLLISLVAMLIGHLPINAITEKTNSTTENEEREIPLILEGDISPISIFQPTAYATLYNKVVSVDLSELSEGATVTITRMATGEQIYSQTGMGSMEIDLNACGKGQYQIDVVSGGLWLQGCFIVS